MNCKVMRFIIREQDYEQLIAAGRLTYRSGAVEHWRLTEAVAGFRVMRVDFDRRDTAVASSTLMHLLMDPDGRPERLKLRHFAPDNPADVDVLVDSGSLSVSRDCNDDVTRDELILPPGFGLLMPATIGLALFVWSSRSQSCASAIDLDEQRCFAPVLTSIELEPLAEEDLTVTGQLVAVRPYLIRRNEMDYTIWLDEQGLPVRLEAEDGLRAIEDRYVRHRWLNSDRTLD